jgi:phosphoserine phosphatase RsbU/P
MSGTPSEHLEPHTLACMEVRGGNQAANVSLTAPGLDIHIVSNPFEQSASGGDVHYVSSCGTGRITRMLLADVAGHGSEVSMLANKLHALMRRHINHIDASTLATEINQAFTAVSTPGRFATALIGTFFAPTKELSLVNAGHPPPVVFRARTQTWQGIEAQQTQDVSNLPLGILDDTQYQQADFELDHGDVLLAYTDSLSESKDTDGELLTVNRLCHVLPPVVPGQPLPNVLAALTHHVRSRCDGNLTSDDTTLVLCRSVGGKTRATVRSQIRGLGTWLGQVATGKTLSLPEFTLRNLGGGVIDRLSRFGKK